MTHATPDTHHAEIDGRQIAYRTMGEGSPIVLLNRFRGTLDTWDPLFLKMLAASHTVITFDYPGIGYSEGELPLDAKEVATEVMKLADDLKMDTIAVAGWSYGGLIAQLVAFMYPQCVTGAVLLGTNPPGQNDVPMEPAFAEHALKPTYDLDDYTALFFEPASEASRAAAKASMERTWPHVDHAKVPATMELFQRYIAGMKGFAADTDGFRARYATTNVPFLVISGDHDISFAVDNWYPLVRQAPTLHMLTFPASGHGQFIQHPELTVACITAFLD